MISGRHFPYPVSIARKIMDESDHCALSGEGALEFARSLENYNEICNPEDLKDDDCPYQKEDVRTKEFIPFTKQIYKGGPIQNPIMKALLPENGSNVSITRGTTLLVLLQ